MGALGSEPIFRCSKTLEFVKSVAELFWGITGVRFYKDGKVVYLRTSISSFRD